ncbi:hypothetical protein ACFFRR_003424 [Megaselia abdita]
MFHLCLTALALLKVLVLTQGFVFWLNPDSLENSQPCREFYEIFYKNVNEILAKINETAEPRSKLNIDYYFDESVLKKEKEGEFYNFTIQFDNETDPFYLYAKVPNSYKFQYLETVNPISFIFNKYSVEVIEFDGFPEKYLLKEGTRCRYNCSKLTKECITLECWKRPFVCIGDFKECHKLDGNGTCVKPQEDIIDEQVLDNDNYEVISSTNLWDILNFGAGEVIIDNEGYVQLLEYQLPFYWFCELLDEINVFCSHRKRFAFPSSGYGTAFLKTLTGFG